MWEVRGEEPDSYVQHLRQGVSGSVGLGGDVADGWFGGEGVEEGCLGLQCSPRSV